MKLLRRWIFAVAYLATLPITLFTVIWAALVELIIVGGICWLLGIDSYLNSTYINKNGLFGLWCDLICLILEK